MVIGDAAGFTGGLFIRDGPRRRQRAGRGHGRRCGADSQRLRAGSDGRLPASFERTRLGADMKTYAKAPAFLENSLMYREVGLLLADVLHGVPTST